MLHCLHVMFQMPQEDSELCQIAVMHDLIEITNSNSDARIIVLGLDKKEEGDYFSASSNFPYLYVASNDDLSKLGKKIKSNLEDGGEDGNSPTVKFLS